MSRRYRASFLLVALGVVVVVVPFQEASSFFSRSRFMLRSVTTVSTAKNTPDIAALNPPATPAAAPAATKSDGVTARTYQ